MLTLTVHRKGYFKPGGVKPGTSLATGDRFDQLLEAKLNLDHQNLVQPLHAPNNPFSNHPIQHQPTPFAQPILYPQTRAQPYDHLAIETALHDFSQVHISPDWVAPALPPTFFQWQGEPVYDVLHAPNPNAAEASQPDFARMGLPFDPIDFTGNSLSTFPTPSDTHQHQAPPNGIWNTPQTLPNFQSQPPPSSDDLPPLLKIRVHNTPAPPRASGSSHGPPHFPRQPVNTDKQSPGAWALEMLNTNPTTKTEKVDARISSHIRPPCIRDATPSDQRFSFPSTLPKSGAISGSGLISPGDKKRNAEGGRNGKRRKNEAEARKNEGDEDKKVVIACHMCRARKLKLVPPPPPLPLSPSLKFPGLVLMEWLRCDGARPKCHHCKRRNEEGCIYDAVLRRRGPGKKAKKRGGRGRSGSSGSEDGEGDEEGSEEMDGSRRGYQGNGSGERGSSVGSVGASTLGLGSGFEISTARG